MTKFDGDISKPMFIFPYSIAQKLCISGLCEKNRHFWRPTLATLIEFHKKPLRTFQCQCVLFTHVQFEDDWKKPVGLV